MNKQYTLIKVLLLVTSLALGAGIAHHYHAKKGAVATSSMPTTGASISPYDDARDKEAVAKLFKDDWYWLSVNDYSAEDVAYMLDTRSPNYWEPQYTGKMQIAVLRDADNAFIGFITYYMYEKTGPFLTGKILFLAINPDFRGKHYGELLLKYAIKELFAQGAQIVRLVTRTTNIKAQKLYMRAGMTNIGEENGFVHFVVTR